MRILFALLFVFACAGASIAQAVDPALLAPGDDVLFVDEIVITERDGGAFKVTADLYRPAGGEKLPGIVIAHGGGFVAGSKDAFGIPEVSRYFARNGFVVLAVDYRLLQHGGLFPKNAQDVKCAIQWLRANADAYGVDTARIAIQGNSAGGYMASFAAVTQTSEEFNASCGSPGLDAQPPAVDLVVAWYGVHDFTTMTHNLVKAMTISYFQGIKDIPAFKKHISPITYAQNAPPMLLLHGTADQLVPFDQSVRMCEAVNAAGGDCTLIEYPGVDHGFIGEHLGTDNADNALHVTAKWLRERFAAMSAPVAPEAGK